ncbi:MAG: S1-like domain-containing RNA-binding protein [Myxococcota bacterium]|nr:S1-like domain-containing RNA-binding protein [Myxococcota bacterium]
MRATIAAPLAGKLESAMTLRDLLGCTVSLRVRRLGSEGACLTHDALTHDAMEQTVLLPRSEVPPGTTVGDAVTAFVFLDSQDQPIATLRKPRVTLGGVAFLRVTDCTSFGAFVDWGMPKELLVPFAEQTTEPRVGDRHPIGLYVDSSDRLAGTMRISELLSRQAGQFALDEWVAGEAWRFDPELGLFVIVEQTHVGRVPAEEPHGLSRGDAARFRVTNVLPDGKMELSLRGHAHEELERDAQKILERLSLPDAPLVGDRSSPDEIRAVFSLSKKAFKRAVGRLLKERAVVVDDRGFLARPRR